MWARVCRRDCPVAQEAFSENIGVTTAYANSMTIVHKGDGLQFVAMAPDVCKTPSPGGPVPIPYPNIAMSSDLADASKSVKVDGNPAALESSNLRMSTGDEAGTAGGGVVSNKIKGKLTWILYSTDVKFEGKGVVRFLDSDLHNGNGSNTMGTSGGTTYPGQSNPQNIKCDNCGKTIDDPSHNDLQLESSREADDQAMAGHPGPGKFNPMKAAVVIKCEGQKKAKVFKNFAGNTSAPLNTDNFASKMKNIRSGKAIPASSTPKTDTNAPGNCAEQKALYDAWQAGALPAQEGCKVNMSVVKFKKRERRDNVYERVKSCPTCQRVLTSMLCTNPPKKS